MRAKKDNIAAICPKCGGMMHGKADEETFGGKPIINDEDYIFVACEDCGAEFFIHTQLEIAATDREYDHDSVQDARD